MFCGGVQKCFPPPRDTEASSQTQRISLLKHHVRAPKRNYQIATKPAELKQKQSKKTLQKVRDRGNRNLPSPGGRHPRLLVSSLGSCKKQAPSLSLPGHAGVCCEFWGDTMNLPHSQGRSGTPGRSGIQLSWVPTLPRTSDPWERQ